MEAKRHATFLLTTHSSAEHGKKGNEKSISKEEANEITEFGIYRVK
jgi:hypothetical protein